jgi:hypothetical protein
MTYKELVRLATEPGPMQEMAMQALAEAFAADDRADYGPAGHNEQFDIMRFAPEYMDAKMALPRGVPRGDMSPAEEEQSLRNEGGADLVAMYDRQYPESAVDQAGGALSSLGDYLTSQQGVEDVATMARDSFMPVYSQKDSYDWAAENMAKYHDLKQTDPLTATGYLPLAALGYIGTIPGAGAMVSGGRKLGKGARMLYEGLY